MNKRASNQLRNPSGFLVIITFAIVMYIIFLPPEDRAALLDDTGLPDAVNGGGQGTNDVHSLVTENDEFVFVGPGRVDAVSRSSFDHELSSLNLGTKESDTPIFRTNPFSVKYNSFTHVPHEIGFTVENPDQYSDVIMLFTAAKHKGLFTIKLNGHVIFSGYIEETYVDPITIPDNLLLTTNVLTFDVDSPGWAFWTTHQYAVEDFRIQGNFVDTSRQDSLSTFTLRAAEANALETIRLEFIPECEPAETGKLQGYINGNLIFDQIPDCGVRNIHYFEPDLANSGVNELAFNLNGGNVLVDRIKITTTLDEQKTDISYFFELDEDLFDFFVETDEVCGVIDGICPNNCGEDLDQDCCFDEYDDAFWCDLPTQNSGDRCVGRVTESTAARCQSGYEDERGDVPEFLEDTCGDDNDGECPLGCSRFFDKDCCLEDDSGRYWCDDVPSTGIGAVCLDSLNADQCRLCPGGYDGEDSNPSCSFDSANPETDEVELKEDFEVIVEFVFVDDGRNKEAEVIINGFTTNFDTFRDTFERDISRFVKDGSNYITVRPDSDFSLVEIRVDVDVRE